MWKRTALVAVAIWFFGTVVIRLAGHNLLREDRRPVVLVVYALSFLAMAFLVPWILRALGLARDLWPKGVMLLILPTLILDALSCLFFPAVFPNMPPSAAGLFGGWVLICCGGGVTGVWLKS